MNLLHELIQVALGTREGLSREPSAFEWGAMLKESQRQCICGVTFCGVEKLMAHGMTPPYLVWLEWLGRTEIIEKQYLLHRQRSLELSQKVCVAGFCSCVLKGVAIARYYPRPERRQCGDIDLWVDGRRKDVMNWLQSQFKIGHLVWHNAGVDVFNDIPVEIHFHPAWLYNPHKNHILQHFFEKEKQNIQANRQKKVECIFPPTSFDIVFSLVHSYRHFLVEGISIRHIIDYYYILKCFIKESPELKQNRTRIIKRIGLEGYTRAMMYVLHEICGLEEESMLCTPGEKEGRFLMSEIITKMTDRKHIPICKKNSLSRHYMMLRHYPFEVIWMIPWKIWHWGWRKIQL